MELPAETNYQSLAARDHMFCTFDSGYAQSNSTPPLSAAFPQALSSDSLFFNDSDKDDNSCTVESCFEVQCHQVFIGMVTMQYQAQTDVVQLVERLDRACIRFVHFSKENELRSRVFSEKMGLESGWNCHISLLTDEATHSHSPKNASLVETGDVHLDDESPLHSELEKLLEQPHGLESCKNISNSAPGAINERPNEPKAASVESVVLKRPPSKESVADEENCPSLSGFTDSTEQSAPINFDMSNRVRSLAVFSRSNPSTLFTLLQAKLPRGIENIRPHLENVDNVPLLVSLFTDCSPDTTREMLSIMQSYGEIVVCLGSSASNANANIFLHADCSIAIEPLYPQLCQEFPSYTESNILSNRTLAPKKESKSCKCIEYEPSIYPNSQTISPIYLSRQLNAVPCSITVCRDDPVSILALIELSRRFSIGLWSCIQFWACCGCSLALVNTVCACLALPPLFSPLSVIYLMGVVVPLLSATLAKVDSDPDVMNRASTKKHNSFDSNEFVYAVGVYGCKFLPTIIIMVLSYCAITSHTASDSRSVDTSRCFSLYAIILHFGSSDLLLRFPQKLIIFVAVTISITFVHRDFMIWKKNPLTNTIWLIFCIFL